MKIMHTLLLLIAVVSCPLIVAKETGEYRATPLEQLLVAIEVAGIIELNNALEAAVRQLQRSVYDTLSLQRRTTLLNTIQELLVEGANPNRPLTIHGSSLAPLYVAVANRIPAAVRILLSHGAWAAYSIVSLAMNSFIDQALLPKHFLSSTMGRAQVRNVYTILTLLTPDQTTRKERIIQFAQNLVSHPAKLAILNARRNDAIEGFYYEPKSAADNLTKTKMLDLIKTHLDTLDPDQARADTEDIDLD